MARYFSFSAEDGRRTGKYSTVPRLLIVPVSSLAAKPPWTSRRTSSAEGISGLLLEEKTFLVRWKVLVCRIRFTEYTTQSFRTRTSFQFKTQHSGVCILSLPVPDYHPFGWSRLLLNLLWFRHGCHFSCPPLDPFFQIPPKLTDGYFIFPAQIYGIIPDRSLGLGFAPDPKAACGQKNRPAPRRVSGLAILISSIYRKSMISLIICSGNCQYSSSYLNVSDMMTCFLSTILCKKKAPSSNQHPEFAFFYYTTAVSLAA